MHVSVERGLVGAGWALVVWQGRGQHVSAAQMEMRRAGALWLRGDDDARVLQVAVQQSGADRHDSERAGPDEQLVHSVSGVW